MYEYFIHDNNDIGDHYMGILPVRTLHYCNNHNNTVTLSPFGVPAKHSGNGNKAWRKWRNSEMGASIQGGLRWDERLLKFIIHEFHSYSALFACNNQNKYLVSFFDNCLRYFSKLILWYFVEGIPFMKFVIQFIAFGWDSLSVIFPIRLRLDFFYTPGSF